MADQKNRMSKTRIRKKILYVRSGPYPVDLKSYNLQELGLSAALKKMGYECDVMYCTSSKNRDEVITKNGEKITILWRKAIRLLRSGIYPSILRKSFLSKYDAVICSEYSQIMSVLLLMKHKNVYIYNGPYYNLFKFKILEPIYDYLFCKFINRKAKKVFCKTRMSEKYLNKKGITNTMTIGVGLDVSIFNEGSSPELATKKILSVMKGHKNFLYVGSISDRKNIILGIKAFSQIARHDKNYQFILIGSGEKKYVDKCKQNVPLDLVGNVKWFNYIKNSQVKYIYEKADYFILPSKQEIFGMVLLEAMYFGDIVVSSNTAGASTLIDNGRNGFIVGGFDVSSWVKVLKKAVECDRTEVANAAKKTIRDNYVWDKVASLMMQNINDGGGVS